LASTSNAVALMLDHDAAVFDIRQPCFFGEAASLA
jgi:hypothetical protein